jgi:valyl-tRNA synthetase
LLYFCIAVPKRLHIKYRRWGNHTKDWIIRNLIY